MTLQISRDVACADGAAAIAELVFRLTANGFAYVAHSTGSSGARSTLQPANATDLATALRTGHSAWVCVSRSGRAWSWQRSTGVNPDYRAWKMEYTASGALTAGSATAPDRNSSTSQYVGGNNFRTVMPGSSTGGTTVNDAMKCHIVVDDAGPSFVLLTRRTPLPVGNVGAAGIIACDALVNPVWSGNTDPVALVNAGVDSNTADAQMVSTACNHAWIRYGLGGAVWTAAGLENPAAVAGNTSSDQGGNDVLFDARWYAGANVLGTSTLFKLLQPGRTPVVGVDSGGTLTHAAFWTVAVPNDGVALTS
jgi:hypothetical protein